ncbi:MAG: hypothetical protein CVU11_02260 [Bacteroidetes bacterium HGW-Bacteroidetes-6]|jgi:hypothetical protein|nr:MAG: hypothetical protein CVU11_02260 [Bacteroidetes bacterium HGW-Bacteroidetes-6]
MIKIAYFCRGKSLVLFLVALVALSVASCTGQKCTYCNDELQGNVQQNIAAKFDTSVHFSIYIPAGTGDTKLPLLVLFDAHGKTAPVLKMYKPLADRYHVVMAGFDPSANEVPFEKIQKNFKPWLEELSSIAPVDTSMMFLAGFSGGARVVSMFENMLPQVKATALCGAGPANPQVWMQSKRSCMAFCGSGDFNYLELLNVQAQSRKSKYLPVTVFSGKHEWPPVDVFGDFFCLINRLAAGSTSNATAEKEILDRCRNMTVSGRPDMAMASAGAGIYALGQNNANSLVQFSDSLGKAIPASFIEEYDAAMMNEVVLQGKIRTMFQLADTVHFAAFLDSLQNNKIVDTLSLGYDLSRRLKAYCGIVAYSFSSQAFKAKTAQLFSQLRMYQMVEPDNNEMLFLFAAFYAGKKDCVQAQAFLYKAKQNGFSDKSRYNNTHEFDGCRSGLEF